MSRLRIARVAGAAAFFAGLLAFGAAQTAPARPTGSSPAASPSTPSSSSASASTSVKRPRAHFFVGEVVEVLAGQTRFSVRETLRDGAPKVTFFTATAETAVLRGKDRATLADLRVNDHVTIKYAEGTGEKQAISIRITPSAKSKSPSPPPPAPTT
jgi:hypothetical protein